LVCQRAKKPLPSSRSNFYFNTKKEEGKEKKWLKNTN